MPSFEFGVWHVLWKGKKKVRDGQESRLYNLAMRRGPQIDSWTYERGWTEQWIIQGTGEVIRHTRESPFHGWKLTALGIRDVEVEGLGSWKEVAEVWTKGEVSREAAMRMGAIAEVRFLWYM